MKFIERTPLVVSEVFENKFLIRFLVKAYSSRVCAFSTGKFVEIFGKNIAYSATLTDTFYGTAFQ